MQFSTTPTLEGQPIIEYCGVVTGEAILGANVFRDFFASIRDIVGGRSGAYEKELRKAREIAFEELSEQAKALGANAVVGIDIDYETVGKDSSMLMVSVSGTAVKTRRENLAGQAYCWRCCWRARQRKRYYRSRWLSAGYAPPGAGGLSAHQSAGDPLHRRRFRRFAGDADG